MSIASLVAATLLLAACATAPDEHADLAPLKLALTTSPQELRERAAGPSAKAQLALALLYENGRGVAYDPVEAARLRKAATASRGRLFQAQRGPLDLEGEKVFRENAQRYDIVEPQVAANRACAKVLAAGDRSAKAVETCGGEVSYAELAALWR
ncbi:MAG: hypothetical protein QM608_09265 [Caulobacter sp.]